MILSNRLPPPLSRPAAIAWSAFYALFLLYAARCSGEFLFIDNVNLPIHEGGHLLFSYCGHWLMVAGGTILQWAAPLMLAVIFWRQRQMAGLVFCLFFFFENWLYTATYMADARALELPLVAVGGGDAEHDWNYLFTSLGCLEADTRIAACVRFGGWLGMIASVALLLCSSFCTQNSANSANETRDFH